MSLHFGDDFSVEPKKKQKCGTLRGQENDEFKSAVS